MEPESAPELCERRAGAPSVMAPLLTGVLLDRGGCPSAADADASTSASGSGGGSHGS